jgi:peptidoglycan/LPS O-acetylase OafA/YrhL
MKKYLFSEFYIDQKDFLALHALRTIALIQFIILHPLINFAQYTDSKVIQSLAHNLFVCMDILFLLSGYFIYFSISKENLKNYYIKRLIRIIPTFYIAFILYFYLIHQELNKTSKIINLNSDNNQLLELYKVFNLSIQYWWGMFYLSRIIYQRESLM